MNRTPDLSIDAAARDATDALLPFRAEFLIPPFSVLSAREGWWQDRKRAWLALGLKSEIGRGGNLIGRSLHEMVAMAISSGAGVGGRVRTDPRGAARR